VWDNKNNLTPRHRAAVVHHILRYELYRHRRLVQRIIALADKNFLADTTRNANTWEVIFFLCRSWLEGAVPTASDVFLTTGLSKGTATTCLNRLDKAGLIQRTPGKDDRRQRFIQLDVAYGNLIEQFVIDCHDEFQQLIPPDRETSDTEEQHQNITGEEQALNGDTTIMACLGHDLRAPLNTIIGYSEAIKEELLGRLRPSGYIEYANDIYQAAQHLSEMVNDLIDLSQFEMTGTLPIQPTPIDVAELIKSSTRLISHDAERKSITLSNHTPRDTPAIEGDDERIKRALLNLLSNAVKFTPTGGQITIGIKVTHGNPTPAQVQIIISDTGPGIPEDALSTVVAPFVRLDPTGRFAETGTGLGLAIANCIAKAHRGSLKLENAAGQGTRATLSFPAIKT
jgi:signal transduction histidine kinase